MTRRRFFQAFIATAVTVCILALSGVLSAQGNRDNAFERVKQVQERHTEALMAREGVVGTAIGLGDDGNPALMVLLEHGAVAGIPAQLDGVKVNKVVTGEIVARVDRTAPFARPVPIGVSTGNEGECSAGTIGCRVTDGTNVYALSNNHVYALENKAVTGSNIVQPGLYDTQCAYNAANKIGTLYAFEPIARSGNTIDAAIALCEGTLSYSTPDDGYGAPSSTPVTASLHLSVKKYGRTTGLTYGTVAYVNVTTKVQYSFGVARFNGQIGITPGSFSAAGDSGSLIVTEVGNSPVGLLFAGSDTVTIANPIQLVLDRFGVTIDDGSGGTINPPVANFSASPTSGVAPVTVEFTDLSSGSPTSWSWTFGDGGNSALQNPSHTYSAAGSYTVALTATNADGSDTVTKTNCITVTSPSGGDVTVTGVSPDTVNAGTSITVTIGGSGFVSGAKVTFENGAGPAPSAKVSALSANSIGATVTVKSGGPSGSRIWDVRVTNPDGSSGVLASGFTVTR
jgi:PKD repeat protein